MKINVSSYPLSLISYPFQDRSSKAISAGSLMPAHTNPVRCDRAACVLHLLDAFRIGSFPIRKGKLFKFCPLYSVDLRFVKRLSLIFLQYSMRLYTRLITGRPAIRVHSRSFAADVFFTMKIRH